MKYRAMLLATILTATAGSAHAGLLGSSVTLSGEFPAFGTVFSSAGPTTVTAALEFALGSLTGYSETFDVTDSQIIITAQSGLSYANGAFNGFVFDFTGAPGIVGATLDGASTLAPLALSFNGTEVAVNMAGLPSSVGDTTIINVAFGPTAAPEPASIALLGAGAIGLCLTRRRTG